MVENSLLFLRAQRNHQGNYLNHTGIVSVLGKGPGAHESDLGVGLNLQLLMPSASGYITKKSQSKLGMEVHVYSYSTQEAEARGP